MYSYGPPHMAEQKQDDQLEHTYSSYVRIRDVTLKTCRRRWTTGRSGERGSGISVLAVRHDDDDLSITVIFIYAIIIDSWFVPNHFVSKVVKCHKRLRLELELSSWITFVTFRPLVKQTTTRNLYITIYIYFLDGRLCEVGAVRRGIRIVRRWGLNFSMSGYDDRDNAHSVTTREVSWTAGSFFSVLPSVQFVGLILPSNSHAEIRTRLHASAISSDIRRSGCVTSAPFGKACVIVVERK